MVDDEFHKIKKKSEAFRLVMTRVNRSCITCQSRAFMTKLFSVRSFIVVSPCMSYEAGGATFEPENNCNPSYLDYTVGTRNPIDGN
jgi:hypothetical protein